MSIAVHELGLTHVPLLKQHFLALDFDDRRLRFGIPLKNEQLVEYVDRIRFGQDVVFGVYTNELKLVGVAHLASRADPAELGLSVLPEARGMGVGTVLFDRAAMRARNLGIVEIFMHCLAQNNTVLHIARKAGMRIAYASGEAEAWLELPPATPASHGLEIVENQAALLDWAVKAALVGPRALLALSPT
jgi:GNAT superfamily N-acetyltransferase